MAWITEAWEFSGARGKMHYFSEAIGEWSKCGMVTKYKRRFIEPMPDPYLDDPDCPERCKRCKALGAPTLAREPI